jgi:hypothetical protein
MGNAIEIFCKSCGCFRINSISAITIGQYTREDRLQFLRNAKNSAAEGATPSITRVPPPR